jgi:hypothetical protein
MRRGNSTFRSKGLATELDTEHRGMDANMWDEARQVGRLNAADLHV